MQFNLKAAIVLDPLVVSPDTTVQAAIAQMSDTSASCAVSGISDRPLKKFFEDGRNENVPHEARSSCLLVVVADRLAGMLTMRDVVRLSAQQQDLRNLPVAKVMTRSIISCREADFTDPFMAAKLFEQHRIRHLPILDDGDRLVGVLTHKSLVQAVLPPHLLRSRLVAEVMTEPAICVPSDASMLAIAQLMAERDVGEVAIGQTQSSDRGHQHNPIGIVTERDVVQLQALGIDLATCPVLSVMDTRIVAVQPEDSLATVQQTLEQHHIQQLMVMGDEGAWLGTVTQSSLLQLLDPVQLWQVAAALGQRVAQLESEKTELQTRHAIALEQQAQAHATAQETKAAQEKLMVESLGNSHQVIQQQQAFLRSVIDCSPNMIFVKDWDGRYLLANQPMADFYNTTIEHLLGKTDADLHGNSKEAERFLEENRRIIQTQKELFLAEEQVTHPVLGGQWLQWHKRPIQLPHPNILGVFGVGVNITARKQTELFLQESERRFATLAEMAPVGIFHTDLMGNCTYVNDRYCQITGYSPVEVMQQGWEQCLHPDDRHWVIAEWQKSIREQRSVRLEFRYQQPDGTVKWVYGQSVVERGDDGQAIGYLGTLTDISDRKHIETQLNLKNDLLAKIACKEPLSDVFHSLIVSVEQILDGALCSILLVDAEHRLRHGAALNLPLEYCQAIDGIQVGDGVGSCGTAIARNQTIIVPDIATDPLWQAYKDVALQYGLQACWSTPIATSDGRVVGTFGIYYREVRSPQPNELDIMLGMANIAGIAIERQQAEEALQKSEAHLRALVHALPDLIVRVDRAGIYLEFAASPTFYVIGNIPDLVGTHVFESLPPDLAQKRMKFIEQALETNSIQLYEQEFFINGKTQFEEARVVPYNADEVLILVRDISDRKQAEQQLQNLIAGTAATTGQDFFPALVRHIAEALHVSYALVTEYVDDMLHVLAFWADGALQSGFSYHPVKTPCERALQEGRFYCGFLVQQQFPADRDLVKMEAESYLGIALHNAEGQAIGNLCILDRQPIHNPQKAEQILRVFAARAAAELERQRAIQALERLNQELEIRVVERTAALRDREAQLQDLFENANDLIQSVRLEDGRFEYVNRAWRDTLGYSEAEIAQLTIFDVLHPEYHEHCHCLMTRIKEGNVCTLDRMELTFLTKDRREILLEGSLNCRVEGDRPVATRAIFRDISDRKRAEANIALQLRRQEALGAIAQQIRESLDIGEILATVTQRVKEILECDRAIVFQLFPDGSSQIVEEAVSSEFPTLKHRHWDNEVWSEDILNYYWQGQPRIVPDVMQNIWTDCLVDYCKEGQIQSKIVAPILQEIRTSEVHRWVSDREGDRLWGVLVVHACREKRVWQASEAQLLQQIANQLAIAIQQAHLFEQLQRELTERQQAQQQLTERNQQLAISNEELLRATRLKDEFLANMSHELRTPLNAILGMTEGLQDRVFGEVNPRQIKALQTIERSGSHLLELIDDILDVAKIESGQLKLDRLPTAVAALCNSSLAFVRQQALKKRIQIQRHIPPNLPKLLVDERRIRQVLINLLNNAVKFTPEGGRITLEASLTPKQGCSSEIHQNYLRIAVTDTGIGIAPEDVKKLFQPFIQIDSALNRQYQGTGLGLALVKRIVDLHGGQVGLTSEVGVGSCFTIDLPSSSTNLPAVTSKAQPQISPDGDRIPLELSPSILLVEDNEANISTLTSYLQAKGYHILLAKTGYEAISLAQSATPSLILMDIQMPEMDGLEAIQQIRCQPRLMQIPIVALTALAMDSDRERCLAAGANEYLSKPFKLKELTQTIQSLLSVSHNSD